MKLYLAFWGGEHIWVSYKNYKISNTEGIWKFSKYVLNFSKFSIYPFFPNFNKTSLQIYYKYLGFVLESKFSSPLKTWPTNFCWIHIEGTYINYLNTMNFCVLIINTSIGCRLQSFLSPTPIFWEYYWRSMETSRRSLLLCTSGPGRSLQQNGHTW